MKLQLDFSIGDIYKSKSQKMRVVTESWVTHNSYCPICGNDKLSHYEANRPVADFYCANCHADFELKSKDSQIGCCPSKIADGAYETMISRINSNNNPHFFFLIHHDCAILHFFVIPKYYFVPHFIEKRTPLSDTARRAGWIGCNIKLSDIPATGIIFIVKDQQEEKKDFVLKQILQARKINEQFVDKRGWLLDVLKCVEEQRKEFSLKDIYSYAESLKNHHQMNHFIEAKIRQQLQVLRDKGFLEFLGRGQYRKLI